MLANRAFRVVSGAVLSFVTLGAVVAGEKSCPSQRVKQVAFAAEQDIVDTAVAAGSFKTLAKALEAAGLVETLKGKGPFTVFAPTDEAFAKLPKGALEELLKDKEKLTAVLTYHVVSGKVKAADVVKLDEAKTVQGASAKVSVQGGKVKIDNANVTKTDIDCSNGVIHVIDAVIMPRS